MTVIEAYNRIKEELAGINITDAEAEARIIMRESAGVGITDLHTHPDKELDREKEENISDVIKRRLMREPLQYIYGSWSFMGLDFYVGKNVLIPRSDTEILAEAAMKELHDGMRLLDMCTGTGCILISLLKYSNDCTGVGVDISGYAIELAKRNAVRNECADRASFLQGDLYDAIDKNDMYDVIVSNPPYIARDVIDTLEPEVRDHEPVLALDGGEDGLGIIRRIIEDAPAHLVKGGLIYMEIGYDQGSAVFGLMEKAGLTGVEVIRDYAGLDRVVRARRPIL